MVERTVTRLIKRDLFGCIDVLATRGAETLAVQVTSGSNVASRVKKIEALDDGAVLCRLLKAGWRVEVHGWRKNAAGRWVCREVVLEEGAPT